MRQGYCVALLLLLYAQNRFGQYHLSMDCGTRVLHVVLRNSAFFLLACSQPPALISNHDVHLRRTRDVAKRCSRLSAIMLQSTTAPALKQGFTVYRRGKRPGSSQDSGGRGKGCPGAGRAYMCDCVLCGPCGAVISRPVQGWACLAPDWPTLICLAREDLLPE